MRTLATRELVAATRTAAVPVAALALLASGTAFVLIWAPRVPTLTPGNLYEQARTAQWIVLAAVLPWTAVRSSPMDRRDAIALMSPLMPARPSVAIAAKVLGAVLVQLTVVLAGLPALVLAQQAAAVPLASVFADLLPVLGLALLVSAASTGSIIFAADGLRAALWASVIVLGVSVSALGWTSNLWTAGALCAAAGMAMTACLCSIAGGSPDMDGTHGR
jgi:hypothetical protein